MEMLISKSDTQMHTKNTSAMTTIHIRTRLPLESLSFSQPTNASKIDTGN